MAVTTIGIGFVLISVGLVTLGLSLLLDVDDTVWLSVVLEVLGLLFVVASL